MCARMSMCGCVCVCVCVCVHTHIDTHIHMQTHIHTVNTYLQKTKPKCHLQRLGTFTDD